MGTACSKSGHEIRFEITQNNDIIKMCWPAVLLNVMRHCTGTMTEGTVHVTGLELPTGTWVPGMHCKGNLTDL